MSYAIIRNEKLTRAESYGAYVHNDRKAKNHSNKDIDPTRTHLNFYFKKNSKLHRIIDKFYETIDKFIHWICEKFDMGAEDYLIRDFQKETNTFLDPEKQIKKGEKND